MVRPIEPPGRIACDPPRAPTNRLELLEYVNELNTLAAAQGGYERYWTVTVLYNTVVYKGVGSDAEMCEVYEGLLK